MSRTVPRSLVVLSALVMGLAITDSGSVSAKATRTAVEGLALSPGFGGAEPWVDQAGGIHFRHFQITWSDFTLHGEGIDIRGSLFTDFNGNTDQEGNGPISGTFVARTGDEVIWEGRMHGLVVGWMASTVVTAHGKGPFAGKLLQLVMEENDPSDVFKDEFDLTGWVLDLGR
jgi:hypothetical protein